MSFLNKNIISFEPKIFGLDLSDLSIKILQFEREGKIEKIRSYSALDIPAGLVVDGKIIDKAGTARAIKETIAKAGPKKINTNKVICSLPESKAFLRIISIPQMEESEVAEAIKWEMEANIPLPIEQVYFDWQFLGTGEKNKQNILTAAVAKEAVDELMETLGMAGLDVYGLEIESIASVRSLVGRCYRQKCNINERTVLVVDLGSQRTSFIMVVGGAPYFTSSIPFSAASINDAISKSLNLGTAEAEEFKVNHGIENLNSSNPIFSAIRPLLENLVREINSTLDFYRETAKESSEIERIVLCGGGANLRGLISFLTKKLQKEVDLGDPWVNLHFGNNLPMINKENSVRYSTVVGLAMRGLDYEN